MLEQLVDEQLEDVVQLVEITNNVQTAPPPPTAPPIESQPLSDSGEGVDALTAPTAGNADAAAEPLVTATIPAALVAEGTDVSLSLQDSFQVQEAPSTDVAAASDSSDGFVSTSAETVGDAGGTTEAPSSNAVDAASTELAEPDAAEPGADETATSEEDQGATAESDADSDNDVADESVAEAGDDSTDDDTPDAEAVAEDSAPATTDSATDQAPLVVAVKKVDRNQAQQTVSTADAQATNRTVEELGLPDLGGRQTPSPKAIGSALTNIRQQGINAVRGGGNQP